MEQTERLKATRRQARVIVLAVSALILFVLPLSAGTAAPTGADVTTAIAIESVLAPTTVGFTVTFSRSFFCVIIPPILPRKSPCTPPSLPIIPKVPKPPSVPSFPRIRDFPFPPWRW
jgi:hypothetical protein